MPKTEFPAPQAVAAASLVRDAAHALAAGRTSEALALCAGVLAAQPDHSGALHLLGIALTRQARAAEAVVALERASTLDPTNAGMQLALGNAWRKLGDSSAAARAFERAMALDPRNPAPRFNLALAMEGAGQPERAIELLASVVRANPMDFEAAQMLVERVAASAGGGIAADSAVGAGLAAAGGAVPAIASVTVGFCTIDERKAAAAQASLARALPGVATDFIVVRGARSLSEAFNRVLDAARAAVVILCHDDIEVLSPRLDIALARALESVDIVGVAGTDRVSGPAVLWSGHPHVHGWVSYPRGAEIEVAPLGFRHGVIAGAQALDGVFMAMRRSALQGLRFDAERFDGFHFYDLDFTYRAHLAGLRLGISTDILLLHASAGRFADDWQLRAARFVEKFPSLATAQGKPHWYGARVASREAALAFYERLRRLPP